MWFMLRLKYYHIMFLNLDGDKSQYWETSVDGHPGGGCLSCMILAYICNVASGRPLFNLNHMGEALENRKGKA